MRHRLFRECHERFPMRLLLSACPARSIRSDRDNREKAKIPEENLKFNISFDLVIEITSGVKYKSTLNYDLPTNSFKDSGTNTKVIEDFSNIIFKRE